MISINHLEKLLFTRELSVLLKSGVSLGEALQSILEKAHRGSLRTVVESVLKDVENGQLLSHALERHPKVFDNLYINLVRIGETSGTLKENLDFISKQLDSAYVLRKKIQGIILYPAIVLSLALLVGAGICIFILPRLLKLFESFNVHLPLATRMLLAFAGFMQQYGVVFFVSLFVLLLVFRGIIALKIVKPFWHRLLLSLPVIGDFFRDISLTHFCRDMGIMLQSGLPILEALDIEEKVMKNRAFARRIKKLRNAVAEGKSMADELSKPEYTIISSLAVKMIAAGEKTGRLSETFLYLEDFFKDEVDRKIKNMTTLLEPVLLIFVGSIVVFLALAILSPIYSLTGSVKR